MTGAVAVMGALSIAQPAEACPDCALGGEVRSEVWSDNFSFNLVAALLPFLAVGAICFGAEAIGQPGNPTGKTRHLARVQRLSSTRAAPRRVRSG